VSSSEVQTEQPARPLLLLLGDMPDLARIRSRAHDVRRWVSHAAPAEDEFAGDPTERATYEWTHGAHGVTAVIGLTPVHRARAALRALRQVRPDAAVLVLSDEAADIDHDRDGTLARGGELRDVLRLDLDDELRRLEAERRAFILREFAAGDDVVPILIHDDPDPDAVSSALAVATLLESAPERTPIVTLDEIRRPENRRMVELLKIRVTRVTEEELQHFDRVITVDLQPRALQRDGRPRLAVIDHHPVATDYHAEFRDVRPEYGATATMLTEYLQAAQPHGMSSTLATALLFGIKTDTDSLTRGVSPANVDAYAFLQERADLALMRRFERPSYPADTARAYGGALASMVCERDLCAAFLGELTEDQVHVLADLADFCLAIEAITWVVVGALVGGELILTLRYAGGSGPGAGAVARAFTAAGGSGGGHATMARATLPAEAGWRLLGRSADGQVPAAIYSLARRTIDDVSESASRRDSRPARRA
jgi:nanoRNase/pAp phosphatase (c-di-AMP/oligoRNAs hydrolase)